MMTPERIMGILQRLGYSIKKRRITDWIAKGLIPKLKQQGHGRGKGTFYYWDDPYILTQFLAAIELMNWYRRTRHVILMLWSCGFNVEHDAARQCLADILRSRRAYVTNKYPDLFYLEEEIDRAFNKNIVNRAPLDGEQVAISEILRIIQKLLTSSEFELEDLSDKFKITELVKVITEGEQRMDNTSSIVHHVSAGLRFVQDNFAPDAKLELLESTSKEELANAQRYWSTSLRFIEPLIRSSQPFDSVAWPQLQWGILWWRIMANLGSNAILLILALQRAGLGTQLRMTSELLERVNTDALRQEIRRLHVNGLPSRKLSVLLSRFFRVLGQFGHPHSSLSR